MLSKKVPFIFGNFISIFAIFLQMSSNTALFSLFFKFNIRFLKCIFWGLRSKQILLYLSKGRGQKLNILTYTPQSVPEMEINHLPQWINLSYKKSLNSSLFYCYKKYLFIYQWRLVTFQPGDAFQKWYDLSIAFLVISDLIYWELLEMD